jgi:hypothetical protein
MCTIGAVSAVSREGKVKSFLVKTADGWPNLKISHRVARSQEGVGFLSFGLEPQGGVNSGMNEFGLGVVISYSDYRFRDPEVYPPSDEVPMPSVSLDREPRTYMNELVLGRCRNVAEAVDFMKNFVRQNPEMMGGNHLLADADGHIAIVEHCEGNLNVAHQSRPGYVARGNNSELLAAEQARIPVVQDSLARQRQMARFLETQISVLESGDDDAFVRSGKALLGSHGGTEEQFGSICVHGLRLRGARAPAVGPAMDQPGWTCTGLIFDLDARRMDYTVGNPCTAEWRTLSLAYRPA